MLRRRNAAPAAPAASALVHLVAETKRRFPRVKENKGGKSNELEHIFDKYIFRVLHCCARASAMPGHCAAGGGRITHGSDEEGGRRFRSPWQTWCDHGRNQLNDWIAAALWMEMCPPMMKDPAPTVTLYKARRRPTHPASSVWFFPHALPATSHALGGLRKRSSSLRR